MTANLTPLLWMALDADSSARAVVAKNVGSAALTAKAIVGWNDSARRIAWTEVGKSPVALEVFQRVFADLDLEREPTSAHFALAQMINSGVVEYVVSFNWDTALERAYEQLYGVPVNPDILVKPHAMRTTPRSRGPSPSTAASSHRQ